MTGKSVTIKREKVMADYDLSRYYREPNPWWQVFSHDLGVILIVVLPLLVIAGVLIGSLYRTLTSSDMTRREKFDVFLTIIGTVLLIKVGHDIIRSIAEYSKN
jgi:hypothetical protein